MQVFAEPRHEDAGHKPGAGAEPGGRAVRARVEGDHQGEQRRRQHVERRDRPVERARVPAATSVSVATDWASPRMNAPLAPVASPPLPPSPAQKA